MDSSPVLALPKFAVAPAFSFSLSLPLFFYAILAAYIIFTLVLHYHWAAYASDVKALTVTYVTYLAITIPLLITMATAAFIA
jgi:hypothetical protein